LFESELSNVEPLRNLIKAISVVVEEGSFRIDEGQMRLLAMDPSHVAMVDFELPREFFDRYSAEGEARLSMNMRELLKFLDRVERGEQLKIRLDEEQSRVILECRRGGHIRTFTLPLIEPMEEEVPSPKIFFKSSARLLTQSLRRAIRDASLVSEHVRIEMTSKELRIQASGEAGSVSSVWEMGADDLLELKAQEDSRATFTISYLQDMINAAAMSSEVTSIELSTDMPIKMNFELPQGKLIYYLAPCIGV
jgi:proliferating cell nuclear antigen